MIAESASYTVVAARYTVLMITRLHSGGGMAAAAAGGGGQTWAPYVHGLVRHVVVVLPEHLNLLADERLVEHRRLERVHRAGANMTRTRQRSSATATQQLNKDALKTQI